MKNIQNRSPRDRLIFALDVGGDPALAMDLVASLAAHVGLFKVGKESFTRYGPDIVRRIQEEGGRVFLDLKYHDIPNTVARAAEAAFDLGVFMLNVHASGGRGMMAETVQAVRQMADRTGRTPPLLLAVTVLTSLTDGDLRQWGYPHPVRDLVVYLARMAQDAGMDGVVASPQEIDAIRTACGDDFVIVTPGIRGTRKIPGDDQKRTWGPAEAVRAGADYLVVGRPIRTAEDPASEADDIVKEIANALTIRDNRP